MRWRYFFFALLLCCNTDDHLTKESKRPYEHSAALPVDGPSPLRMKDGIRPEEYKNGDILFIKCKSDLSSPIQLATRSEYTHCAMFWSIKNKPFVVEAYSEVELTPFHQFMQNREGKLLLVKRLKNHLHYFTKEVERAIEAQWFNWMAKPYDGYFRWSDDRLYCSELVYKLYLKAGFQLCSPKTLDQYALDSPEVKAELETRYNGRVPMHEFMVAPVDLVHSKHLDTLYFEK